MNAQPLINTKIVLGDNATSHLVVWQVPKPLPGSEHGFKYRLAYVVDGVCVVRYDNEAGKGDHKHLGVLELAYRFTNIDTLIDDFMADIAGWNSEHGNL